MSHPFDIWNRRRSSCSCDKSAEFDLCLQILLFSSVKARHTTMCMCCHADRCGGGGSVDAAQQARGQ
eukprot:23705-Eustigmatos_ZCMA.PRE.1